MPCQWGRMALSTRTAKLTRRPVYTHHFSTKLQLHRSQGKELCVSHGAVRFGSVLNFVDGCKGRVICAARVPCRRSLQTLQDPMSLGELEEPWGQLVSTELPPEVEEDRVPVLGNTFLIGRAKGQLTRVVTHSLAMSLSLTRSLRCRPGDIWQPACVLTALSAPTGRGGREVGERYQH